MMKSLFLAALAVACVGSAQAYSLFDFEGFAATNTTGAFNSLSSTKNGLTLTITRSSGTNFDVIDNGLGTFPLTWDARSLDPFFDCGNDDYFVGDFSSAVSAVELEMTDFGQDSDLLEMNVWSGAGGTGTLLAAVTADWGLNSAPSYAGLGWNGVGDGLSAMSITFRGGARDTETFNSMYVDNIAAQAVPEPATLLALGLGAVALLRRRRAK